MNGSYLTKSAATSLLLMLCGQVVSAQFDSLRSPDPIQVVARPSSDSIVLRWAPTETEYWLSGNKHGYMIERHTLTRNGKVLDATERKVLTPAAIKPLPEPQWERIVVNNKYGAIAAQALLGETFDLSLKQSDVFTIVNKSKENDQRFSMALFCADLSVKVAKGLGLYFCDKSVKRGEKYLYRIVSQDAKSEPIAGSVFVGTDDPYTLLPPKDFSLQSKDKLVALRWDQSYHKRTYTAYVLEKSEDGTTFQKVFDDAITTLAPTRADAKYQYVNDTVQFSGKEYHYRLIGISPFGESGPPSDVLKVTARKQISDIPYITSAHSPDNKIIELTWEFPEDLNTEIEGFTIERAPRPSGKYDRVNKEPVPKEDRTFTDHSPKQTNYYRVVALTTEKKQVPSMDYFIHLIDSIPPAPPAGIQGTVDELGSVTLTWTPNTEQDIYGYRIYRAYYVNEEFAQLTSGPIAETRFNDKVVLKSLNEKVHYQVMAIDVNQNHSALSDIYSLSLPDKVPPVTPVFLPVKSSTEGVQLTWMKSSSTDVVKYSLFRKGEDDRWIPVVTMPAHQDTLYLYHDTSLKNGELKHYTVVAIDEKGLESPPASPVTGSRIRRSVWPSVTIEKKTVDRSTGKLVLEWSYDQPDVIRYLVYKSINDEPWKLYRSVTTKQFKEQLHPGHRYRYSVVAIFADGSKSEMPKGILFTY